MAKIEQSGDSVLNVDEESMEKEAPTYALSVTPEEIVRQRELGWPDFHPETYCHCCGRRNITWWVESQLWNVAVRKRERNVVDILCPVCFVAEWERQTGTTTVWELRLNIANDNK